MAHGGKAPAKPLSVGTVWGVYETGEIRRRCRLPARRLSAGWGGGLVLRRVFPQVVDKGRLWRG